MKLNWKLGKLRQELTSNLTESLVSIGLGLLVISAVMASGSLLVKESKTLGIRASYSGNDCFDTCREDGGTVACNTECNTDFDWHANLPGFGVGDPEDQTSDDGCSLSGGHWCTIDGESFCANNNETCQSQAADLGMTVLLGCSSYTYHPEADITPGAYDPGENTCNTASNTPNIPYSSYVIYLCTPGQYAANNNILWTVNKYVVQDKVITDSLDTSWLIDQGKGEVLVLQTCDPPGTSLNRLVVEAVPVEY